MFLGLIFILGKFMYAALMCGSMFCRSGFSLVGDRVGWYVMSW